MADRTELTLRIVPELDAAAKKKVQDELDKISGTISVTPSTGGKGSGSSSTQAQANAIRQQTAQMQAQTQAIKDQDAALKSKLKTIRAEIDAQDLALRTARSAAQRKIEFIRQQAAVGEITADEMNQQIMEQERLIVQAETTARQEYAKTAMVLEELSQEQDGLNQGIIDRQKQLFYASERLNSGFNSMSGSMQKVVSQTKNANLAFMNFGRIVQDAPFGLIGIANNIDPLLVSFSNLSNEIDLTTGKMRGFGGAMKALGAQLLGPAGLIFLIGSALPSALLWYESSQRNANKATDEARESTAGFVAQIDEMRIKFDLAADGMMDRDTVLKQYNDTLGKTLGTTEDFNVADERIFANTDNYVMAMYKRAQAQALLNEASRLGIDLLTGEASALKIWQTALANQLGLYVEFLFRVENIEKAESKRADLLREINNLYKESLELNENIFSTEREKAKFVDKTLLSQAQLRIGAENSLQLAQDENLSWEQRQRAMDDGIAKSRQIVALQQQSVAEQLKIATEESERINLQVRQIELGQELVLLDRQALEFARERADAEFQIWATRQQALLTLRDELLEFESQAMSSLLGDVDTDDGIAQARFDDATQWIDRQAEYEIEKALYVGDRIKALDLEKNLFIQQRTREYTAQNYDLAAANAMAISDANKEFALAEKQVRLDAATEMFQGIGELASQAIGAIFGESKGAAIAQVVIDTAMGVQKIWAQSGINPIIGGLASAALIAKGAAAISKIRSANKDSASVGGAGDGGTTVIRESYYDAFAAAEGRRLPPTSMANTAAEALGDRSLEIDRNVTVTANIDRRGLAIAVREGEMDIRTAEFTYS